MSDQTVSPSNPSPLASPAPAPGPLAEFVRPQSSGAGASVSVIPPTVPLTIEEYHRLRSLEKQLEGFQKAQQAALESKEAERLRALAEKGQIEEALDQQRKTWEQKHAEALSRYTQLEQQVHSERKNSAIMEAFHGRSFVGETPEQKAAAAAMVRRLLQDDFETSRDASGGLVVREKISGRPAAEVLRERLVSTQYAIFFAPTSRGGAGTDGTRPPSSPQPTQPGSLDAIVADWRNRQSQYQSFGLRPKQ